MNVQELIEHLSEFESDAEVMILDGFNGGGNPREINFKPINLREITSENADEAADCEELVGTYVVVLGYGCY